MKNWLWMGGAIALTLPGLYLRFGGLHAAAPVEAVVFGVAILGAAFLLSWAADAAQVDISQSLALAFLALLAVLPEYVVDLYFAWTAGKNPEYAAYAVANMTGANRLLIGLAWASVIFLFWLKTRNKSLKLEKSHTIELSFLALATLYSFTIPLKGSIHLVDTVILFSLFGLYMWAASRARAKEPELVGPSLTIGSLPTPARRGVIVFLFLFSGLVILAGAEPFAEGLVESGKILGLEQFILVQWLAPLASEAPEFFVAALFALRGNAVAGMAILISSKVNQWTLLLGSLPVAYSASLGTPAALPLDARQVEEVFLTVAQSVFAIVILANLRISLKSGAALFLLFATQLFFFNPLIRWGYSAGYLTLAAFLLIRDRERLKGLLRMIPNTIAQVRTPDED